MKNYFIILSVLLLLFCTAKTTKAQNTGYSYHYDNAGNRLSRVPFKVKSSAAKTEQKSDEIANDYKKSIKFPVKVFPNPTTGKVSVIIQNLTKDNEVRLQLFTVSGKLIISKKTREDKIVLDISTKRDGVYLLKIYLGEEIIIRKIVKQ